MKRVTLKKLYDETRPIQAIKALRASTRNSATGLSTMDLRTAKNIVMDLRADGRSATVRVEHTADLSDFFEFVVIPNDEYFRTSNGDSTVLVTDKYPLGADGCGNDLFVEVADGDVPMTSHGLLDARHVFSGQVSRPEAERLYAWLGEWLSS